MDIRCHVYKVKWTPILDEVVICRKDNCKEAKEYDLNDVGGYKESPKEGNLDLAGHVPIELSRLLAGFQASSETNFLTVKTCGKQKCEAGLVVPACYQATTNRKKVTDKKHSSKRRCIMTGVLIRGWCLLTFLCQMWRLF